MGLATVTTAINQPDRSLQQEIDILFPTPECPASFETLTTTPCPEEYMATTIGKYVEDKFKLYEDDQPFLSNMGNVSFVQCDLARRLASQSFCQNARNSCGPTAVLTILSLIAPEKAADFITEVYFTGEVASLDYSMSSYISELNWAVGETEVQNMALGALLIFDTFVRDLRNQYLADLNPDMIPGDGYDRVHENPFVEPIGSSFFSTAYDAAFFAKTFGYNPTTWIGSNSNGDCTACKDIKPMFPSDLAAFKAVYIGGADQSDYAWSKWTQSVLSDNTTTPKVVEQYFSRLSSDGINLACDNAKQAVLCINMGVYPGRESSCNATVCEPEHYVVLDKCSINSCQETLSSKEIYIISTIRTWRR